MDGIAVASKSSRLDTTNLFLTFPRDQRSERSARSATASVTPLAAAVEVCEFQSPVVTVFVVPPALTTNFSSPKMP